MNAEKLSMREKARIRTSPKIEDFIEARFQVVNQRIDAWAAIAARRREGDYRAAMYQLDEFCCAQLGHAPDEEDVGYCEKCLDLYG